MNRSIKLSYIIFGILILSAFFVSSFVFYTANNRIENLINNSKTKESILAISQINKEYSDLKLSIYECLDSSESTLENIKTNFNIFSMKINQIQQGHLESFFQNITDFEIYITIINTHILSLNHIINNTDLQDRTTFQKTIFSELNPLGITINKLSLATIQYSSDTVKTEQEAIQDFFEFLILIFITFLILLICIFIFLYIQIKNVIKSYKSLSLTTKKLEAANKTKSAFLAHISHELRTPLNAIIGFSDIIRKEYLGKIKQKEYVEYSNEIHDSSNHLLTMINDILDMSKIDAGQRKIHLEKIQITTLIEQSLKMLSLKIKEKNITITKIFPKIIPPLYIDPLSIKQCLINIISNSIKFIDHNHEIKISIKREKNNLNIQIKDDGIGMSKEGIRRALTPFQQASDNKYNRGSMGTGLGLPITKSLIELNHGKFLITSKLKKGTTISFLLPIYNSQSINPV